VSGPSAAGGQADSVDAVASTLNQLIQTCKDGEQGFQAAAAGVDDLNLQRLLESYSQQRSEFAAELQLEVERLAENPAESGHLSASLHRGWINIKSVVSGREESAIVAECERGEDAAVKVYQDALSSALPQDLRAVVERQFVKIKEAHDQIRSLEEVHSRHR
jgi:uncharacterized protein (TIGR02284 family)